MIIFKFVLNSNMNIGHIQNYPIKEYEILIYQNILLIINTYWYVIFK